MVKWGQLGLPDPGTLTMQKLMHLHDLALCIGVFVVWIVFVGLVAVVTNTLGCRTIYRAHVLEMVWTGAPAGLLLILAVPSIILLFKMDELVNPEVTVKAIGHQWYWSYEFGDFGNFEFDSYPAKEEGSAVLRLLEVDKRLVLPILVQIRMIVTRADVIHSWAVPELGVKMDGIPGRLNQVPLKILRPGIYRGMCSELCGVNHAYMPIVIEAVPMREFMIWAKKGRV